MLKYIFTVMIFLISIDSFSLNDTKKEKEVTVNKEEIVKSSTKEEDDLFCRICLSKTIINPTTGEGKSVVSCSGNIFTSCEKATESANQKLQAEIVRASHELGLL